MTTHRVNRVSGAVADHPLGVGVDAGELEPFGRHDFPGVLGKHPFGQRPEPLAASGGGLFVLDLIAPADAKKALAEHIATGAKPTSVQWQPWSWEVRELPHWLEPDMPEYSAFHLISD
jgi:hypothetical protein